MHDAVSEVEDDHDDLEVSMSQGVLTIETAGGTWVINKQAPNQQIWWSSPVSGPMRFEYDASSNSWVSTRHQDVLTVIFQDELKDTVGVEVEVES